MFAICIIRWIFSPSQLMIMARAYSCAAMLAIMLTQLSLSLGMVGQVGQIGGGGGGQGSGHDGHGGQGGYGGHGGYGG
ncbi:hypothetical protein AGMMS49992_03250 [Clostridia bacterium]|nr:hypothetical protein AGMMS49992_03250 [Clostridia bacterium]